MKMKVVRFFAVVSVLCVLAVLGVVKVVEEKKCDEVEVSDAERGGEEGVEEVDVEEMMRRKMNKEEGKREEEKMMEDEEFKKMVEEIEKEMSKTSYGGKGGEEEEEERLKERIKNGEPLDVGIDLGTTYSCVCVFENGESTIISDEYGRKTFPSVVSFEQDGRVLVGHEAKLNRSENMDLFYDSKRFLGVTLAELKKSLPVMIDYPFKLVESVPDWKSGSGGGMIQYDYFPPGKMQKERRKSRLMPEEVSCIILKHLKKMTETVMQRPVRSVVLTVPAYFNDNQRRQTQMAATFAKLNVARLINEPTAAAMFYGFDSSGDEKEKSKIVFVFDLGGGTFDVSCMSIDVGVYEVLATHGDPHLGGQDFDNDLMTFVCKDILAKTGQDLKKDKKKYFIPLNRCKLAVEDAKINLSTNDRHKIVIPNLLPNFDYSIEISRAQFENMLNSYIARITKSIQTCLSDAKLSPDKIDDVVLVGGSSRIPRFRNLLKTIFGQKKIKVGLNPDEAVARGAAIQAAIIARKMGDAHDLVVLDVTPMDVGIETQGGIMSVLLPRRSSIPYEKEQIFTTASDNQTAVSIVVYQGSRPLTKDNVKLGSFDVTGIPPAPRGIPQIIVKFKVDVDGIYEVSAYDKNNPSSQKSIKIERTDRQLSEETINSLIQSAKDNEERDAQVVTCITKLNTFESHIYRIKLIIDNPNNRSRFQNQSDYITCCNTVKDAIEWIKNVDRSTITLSEIEAKQSQFDSIIHPITTKMHQKSTSQSHQPDQQQPYPDGFDPSAFANASGQTNNNNNDPFAQPQQEAPNYDDFEQDL